ncbi:unnamed protein product [Brachionus calyciflorus]|uniref:Uncharacterized protein n=1 Tax=Brachionus calyciflorus TaxID=104777 RepID=A0A814APR3_9BILA|nr:unnamed protein product [Brachionus calyciflorus]
MKKPSPFDIEEKILPEIASQICECAEKNDIDLAEKTLNESKIYFDRVTLIDPDINTLFYPAYQLAYLLNHKDFCYKLILKVTEVTGNYDIESIFFDQTYGPYKNWQRISPETIPIPLTIECDTLSVLFLEKLQEKLRQCFIQNDKNELIKTLRQHSTLMNLLQYNRQAFETYFNLYEMDERKELKKSYFEEIDSIIGIKYWTEKLFFKYDEDGITCNLLCVDISDDYTRMSLTAKFFVEKLCKELMGYVERNDVDGALRILNNHEEILAEVNKYEGAIKNYFEKIYQMALNNDKKSFAEKFFSSITEIINRKKIENLNL